MAAIEVHRIAVTDAQSTFEVPVLRRAGHPKLCIIRNAHPLVSFKFNFDGDTTNYFTLTPHQQTPVLSGLRAGDLIYTDGVSGASTAEIIIWEQN